ncbi:hypothetical protein [Mycolicibacterium fortuitum]|uniref:Uncharacterized protein n=2 Tax=Mycolicibacterium fortuitum TaxID=1766 RepID=A0AAE4VD65_MYCFO|nr:hypothetical protein [Mycolicibacterium fortuitum]MDV7193293.1 hypothetical protein [Mycolicibacterium fortuitum]MDV7206026.1 hypothetical protein [Mycolicibacterium fortuitum]MDV7227439.1 hypothetical protein [Mycolicibacterium fortuitum]MDV7259864.1 hypothetical protein [Mycolicibacterium fortuitum]MDV7286013.1 hypothetical protein [Mycolicibacterium fortuitum]
MGKQNYFGRRARVDDPQPRTGTVVRNDDEVSVLIRWDNDATTAGLSWHKVAEIVGEVIVVAPEATPTMHQVAQAAKQAALPPLIGGLPA